MECRKCQKPMDASWVVCPYCGYRPAQRAPRRRANGAGTAFKRGNTWTACVTVATSLADGKIRQVRRTKGGFATKSEALRYCSTLLLSPKQAVPSLATYWETFASGKMDKLSSSKQTSYRIAFNRLAPLAHRPINDITVGELQELMRKTCPTFYPARDLRVLLNHLYKLAAADGNANAGLPGLLELPRLQEKSHEPFTAEEQRRLWAAYEGGHGDAAIPLIMIYTGMMTGELLHLEVEMIDWEKKEIRGAGLKTETRRTKSILLPDAILPVLEDVASSVQTGRIWPFTEKPFYERYYLALTEAGIERKLSPYSCRHTTATALALEEGVAPQIVQRVLRWSSTRMMDRYVHPSDTDARSAVNRLLDRR